MDEDSFDEVTEQHRRANVLYEESLLGLEYWEYKWVKPGRLSEYGADRWRLPYTPVWHKGKLLMERKRLADDGALQKIAG